MKRDQARKLRSTGRTSSKKVHYGIPKVGSLELALLWCRPQRGYVFRVEEVPPDVQVDCLVCKEWYRQQGQIARDRRNWNWICSE